MKKYTITHVFGIIGVLSWSGTVLLREMLLSDIGVLNFILGIMPNISASWVFMWIGEKLINKVSNRRLSQVISADYLRRKYLSQSAVNEPKAFYIGWHRRLSRAYFSSAMAGLK